MLSILQVVNKSRFGTITRRSFETDGPRFNTEKFQIKILKTKSRPWGVRYNMSIEAVGRSKVYQGTCCHPARCWDFRSRWHQWARHLGRWELYRNSPHFTDLFACDSEEFHETIKNKNWISIKKYQCDIRFIIGQNQDHLISGPICIGWSFYSDHGCLPFSNIF